MQLKEFLQTVITAPRGYFCLAIGGQQGWMEEWHKWPEDLDEICARAERQAVNANVYYSTYLFKAPQSIKENVLPSRTIQADLDNADVERLPKEPTVLVQTSPGRHQGYWVLDEELSLEEHEILSRKITYSIPLCDRSGWPLGRKVRIPGTLNHKYMDGPKLVKITGGIGRQYAPSEFELLPAVPQHTVEHYDDSFVENPTGVNDHPLELLEKIKNDIPVRVYIQYSAQQPDRSEALWALMCWGFKVGLNRQQVFTLAKGSANNKFSDLRHRGDQELAKDVLRAEEDVRADKQDDRRLVQDLRKKSLSLIEKKQHIFNVVLASMKAQGAFLHTVTDAAWYIRRDVGRPIYITANSDWLDMMLDLQFGLNATEPESRYVIHGLKSYTSNLPATAVQTSLSHYDHDKRTFLLHMGRRDVMKITADSVEHAIDGAYGVVFPWITSAEPFAPVLDRRVEVDWGEEIFGDGARGYGSSVENVTNMTPEQAMALLKVWFLFVLFRSVSMSRPVIASFGQPGSGKTTLFKKVYAVLYGRHKSLGAVTSMDDFDHAVATDPLVILDNVDTWEKWLPDRIALSAGTSDIIKRRLYTDQDTFVLKRQAIVGVTAHNPKFGREDVADRFLLFAYKRLGSFISEELIITDLLKKRNQLWGSIVRDIQKVLATEVPVHAPQFRVEDFARFGLWIARAIGVEKDFIAAIEDVKSSQQTFSLEEEGILVSAISKFVEKHKDETKTYTASQLWSMLEMSADDSKVFAHVYRNSVALSKKLSSMQVALGKMFVIEQTPNETGVRTWRLAKREDRRNGTGH